MLNLEACLCKCTASGVYSSYLAPLKFTKLYDHGTYKLLGVGKILMDFFAPQLQHVSANIQWEVKKSAPFLQAGLTIMPNNFDP